MHNDSDVVHMTVHGTGILYGSKWTNVHGQKSSSSPWIRTSKSARGTGTRRDGQVYEAVSSVNKL